VLQDYTNRSDQYLLLRDRNHCFQPMDRPTIALWWIPTGHIPTPEEGKIHLAMLMKNGPPAEAFDFHRSFDPPESAQSA